MATTSDISRGVILKLDGSLYSVVEFGENKTARAAAKVWAKLKGVDNKRSIEKTWNSGETIYPVRVEKRAFQFLYKDESGFNLMNNETFEQIALGEEMIDAPQFLKDGSEDGLDVKVPNLETDDEFKQLNHNFNSIPKTNICTRKATPNNTDPRRILRILDILH